MYRHGGGMFDWVGGLFNKVTGAVSGAVRGLTGVVGGAIKGLGITGVSTPFGGFSTDPSYAGVTDPSISPTFQGQSPVQIVAQPQLPTKMIMIAGGIGFAFILLLLFMRK